MKIRVWVCACEVKTKRNKTEPVRAEDVKYRKSQSVHVARVLSDGCVTIAKLVAKSTTIGRFDNGHKCITVTVYTYIEKIQNKTSETVSLSVDSGKGTARCRERARVPSRNFQVAFLPSFFFFL